MPRKATAAATSAAEGSGASASAGRSRKRTPNQLYHDYVVGEEAQEEDEYEKSAAALLGGSSSSSSSAAPPQPSAAKRARRSSSDTTDDDTSEVHCASPSTLSAAAASATTSPVQYADAHDAADAAADAADPAPGESDETARLHPTGVMHVFSSVEEAIGILFQFEDSMSASEMQLELFGGVRPTVLPLVWLDGLLDGIRTAGAAQRTLTVQDIAIMLDDYSEMGMLHHLPSSASATAEASGSSSSATSSAASGTASSTFSPALPKPSPKPRPPKLYRRTYVLPVGYSSWKELKERGDDRAFLLFLGVDRHSFATVAQLMSVVGLEQDADTVTALVLSWLTSTADTRHLQQFFGVEAAAYIEALEEGLQRMLGALQTKPNFQPTWPNSEQQTKLAELLCETYDGEDPRVPDAAPACMMLESFVLTVPPPADPAVAAACYNGLHRKHVRLNLLILTPDGKICASGVGLAGSLHESRGALEAGFYSLIKDTVFSNGYGCIASSAHAAKDRVAYIYSPLKKTDPMLRHAEYRDFFLQTNEWVCRVRQEAAELVKGFKATFARLMVPDEQVHGPKLADLMQLCMLLFNVRAEHVGLSRMKSEVLPLLRRRSAEFDLGVWSAAELAAMSAAEYDTTTSVAHLTAYAASSASGGAGGSTGAAAMAH